MEGELRLPLEKKWFEMSKTVKKEDYREITPHWISRLMYKHPSSVIAGGDLRDKHTGRIYTFKKFDTNVMTLGYPKTGDEERILRFEHKGIEIRTGKPEWGAEEGKLYFVIMHGNQCVKDFKVIDHEHIKPSDFKAQIEGSF